MNPVHFAFLALLFIAVFGTVLVAMRSFAPVSYTHLTLPTNREV